MLVILSAMRLEFMELFPTSLMFVRIVLNDRSFVMAIKQHMLDCQTLAGAPLFWFFANSVFAARLVVKQVSLKHQSLEDNIKSLKIRSMPSTSL